MPTKARSFPGAVLKEPDARPNRRRPAVPACGDATSRPPPVAGGEGDGHAVGAGPQPGGAVLGVPDPALPGGGCSRRMIRWCGRRRRTRRPAAAVDLRALDVQGALGLLGADPDADVAVRGDGEAVGARPQPGGAVLGVPPPALSRRRGFRPMTSRRGRRRRTRRRARRCGSRSPRHAVGGSRARRAPMPMLPAGSNAERGASAGRRGRARRGPPRRRGGRAVRRRGCADGQGGAGAGGGPAQLQPPGGQPGQPAQLGPTTR